MITQILITSEQTEFQEWKKWMWKKIFSFFWLDLSLSTSLVCMCEVRPFQGLTLKGQEKVDFQEILLLTPSNMHTNKKHE